MKINFENEIFWCQGNQGADQEIRFPTKLISKSSGRATAKPTALELTFRNSPFRDVIFNYLGGFAIFNGLLDRPIFCSGRDYDLLFRTD